MSAIETWERNGWTVQIHQDEDCFSPRDDDSPGCRLALFHNRYTLPNDPELDTSDYTGWQAMADDLRISHGALVIMAVYMIDHSGIALRVTPMGTGNPFWEDPGEWDSGTVGLAYVDAKIWKETQGTEWAGSAEQIAQAQRLITSDVEQYSMWLNGECYGYVLTDPDGDDSEGDSCWGYIGWDWATQAANEAADYGRPEPKCRNAVAVAYGQILHRGPCRRHDQPALTA